MELSSGQPGVQGAARLLLAAFGQVCSEFTVEQRGVRRVEVRV